MDIEKYVDLLMLDENTSKHIRRNMILAWNAALDEVKSNGELVAVNGKWVYQIEQNKLTNLKK